MDKNQEKDLLEKIDYYRIELEKAFKEEKSFSHPKVYEMSLKLDKLITQYQKILNARHKISAKSKDVKEKVLLGEEFKDKILKITNTNILEKELEAMYNIINSEYTDYSLRMELSEKIAFIRDRLSDLKKGQDN